MLYCSPKSTAKQYKTLCNVIFTQIRKLLSTIYLNCLLVRCFLSLAKNFVNFVVFQNNFDHFTPFLYNCLRDDDKD